MYHSLNICITVDSDRPAEVVGPTLAAPAVVRQIAADMEGGKTEGRLSVTLGGATCPGYWHLQHGTTAQ